MVDSNQRVVSRKRGQYGAGLVVLSLQKKWWLLPGSNQRPVDYDSIALPTELSSQPKGVKKNGSGSRTRTCDRVVNSHLLYRLSYAGASDKYLI